jgi:hypothetical protein
MADDDLIGKKFGRLTIIETAESRIYKSKYGIKKRIAYLCICDCGKQIEALKHNLLSGDKISCGCRLGLNGEYGEPDPKESSQKELFRRYRDNAKRKSLEFTLDIDFFISLINSCCHYCGIEPNTTFNCFLNKKGENRSKTRGINPTQYAQAAWIIYNGIDRKNNANGYSRNNVVPCCSDCNYMKKAKSYKEFIEWLDRITAFRKEIL